MKSAADRVFLAADRVAANPGLALVLAIYIVYYTLILVAGGGLPYVMDNNETFSALNHAYNLWHFDFLRSYGLTDEAVSPYESAHPVIHTHQGNFPRLFSFVLFALGARSAEVQIFIATFTVGCVSIVFAFLFLRRIAGSLFATTATLLLLTDYLLFAQWQVNTYRVWHCFFFFGALLCVHGVREWPLRRWALTTILLYAALFYGELVFAAFLAFACAAYALMVHWRNWRVILTVWFVCGLGAAAGLSVLVLQLVLYMGWSDLLTDLQLTLTARNFAPNDSGFQTILEQFYGPRNIVFLQNLSSPSEYSGISQFLQFTYRYVFQIHTPIFTIAAMMMVVAVFVADTRPPNRFDVLVAQSNIDRLCTAVLAVSLFTFIATLWFGGAALRQVGDVTSTAAIFHARGLISGLAVAGGSLLLSIVLRRAAAAASPTGTQPALQRSARASVFLFVCALMILLQDNLYDPNAQTEWLAPLMAIPTWLAKLIVLLVGMAGAIVVLTGRRAVLGRWFAVPDKLAPFLVSGLLAYLFVFSLAGGYLKSGYLIRLCPLPVFHADTLLALALFVLLAAAVWVLRPTIVSERIGRKAVAASAASIGIVLAGYWSLLQWRHAQFAPPDQFAFIKLLRSDSSKDLGLVSNNYAAPFGYIAKTWAYSDPGFPFYGGASNGRRIPYLWFADRSVSSDYARPGLFVCFDGTPTISSLVYSRSRKRHGYLGCAGLPLIQKAFAHRQTNAEDTGLRVTAVARDETDGRWAVVRLGWGEEAPPLIGQRESKEEGLR